MKIKFSIIAVACLFACYFVSVSCGGNGPTVQIPIKSMSFDLNDILVREQPQQIRGILDDDPVPSLNYFSETRTFSIDSLNGITDDVMSQILEYQDKIRTSSVGSVTITISTDGEGTFVSDFWLRDMQSPTNLYIERFELGTTTFERESGFVDYFGGRLLSFFIPETAREITFTIEGYTDIPVGQTLNVKFTLDDVMFEAEAIKITNPI